MYLSICISIFVRFHYKITQSNHNNKVQGANKRVAASPAPLSQGWVIALPSQKNFHLRALPNIEKFVSLSLRYNG
ncbi:hypothetical protein E2C01_089987 [Portunus trituberculatus]|uniref:Uncharacterized protein n=1 Tax=Portunus trituberculatus TaxID=210409 RepID=A0A5B7JAA2_PORTR|nr:hypothetical protein [Portunus trituberculatus]